MWQSNITSGCFDDDIGYYLEAMDCGIAAKKQRMLPYT